MIMMMITALIIDDHCFRTMQAIISITSYAIQVLV